MRGLILILLAATLAGCVPDGNVVAHWPTGRITRQALLEQTRQAVEARGERWELLRPDQAHMYAGQVLLQMVDAALPPISFTPTEDQLHRHYDRHPDRWSLPARAEIQLFTAGLEMKQPDARQRAAHRMQAETARQRWTNGEVIEARTLQLRKDTAPTRLADMMFRTPPGQISSVFELGSGVYGVLKVLNAQPSQPRFFGDARDSVRADLQRVEAEKLRQRQRAEVQFNLHYDSIKNPTGPSAGRGEAMIVGGLLLLIVTGTVALWRRRAMGWGIIAVFVLGVVLRFAYWAATPYDFLAHDAAEHLDLIVYWADNGKLPDPAMSFQSYQPPLYYVLCAVAGRVAGDVFNPRVYQAVALMLSVGSWALAIWYLCRLFKPDRPVWAVALILATLPAWLFMAARINNDCLAVFLQVAAAGSLLLWWKHGRTKDWFLAVGAVALALLTKANTMLLGPVFLLALAFHGSLAWREKLKLGAMGAAIVLVVAGWFYIGGHRSLGAGNLSGLATSLRLTDDQPIWWRFNPVALVSEPYIQPWLAGVERDTFAHYFLRSAVWGEFSFASVPVWLARLCVVMTLLLAAGAVTGMVRSKRDGWPWLALTIVLLAGQILYVFSAPVSSSMDFRYVTVLILPAACGVAAFQPRWVPVSLGVGFGSVALTVNTLILLRQFLPA
jgi:hypothetical protein